MSLPHELHSMDCEYVELLPGGRKCKDFLRADDRIVVGITFYKISFYFVYPANFLNRKAPADYLALPCLFFGVSEDDGTRAYIFVNTRKSLGQIAPL